MATPHRLAGFSLIETLAALAVASAIILSTSALIHQNAFFFNRGTRTIDQVEQLTLAIECLKRDFAAARFVLEKTATQPKAAFVATAESREASAKILFVTAGGRAAGPQGEEVVSLSVETSKAQTQLVRRRAAWHGPRTRLDDARPQDAVVLLKGKLDISFDFSELTPNGSLVWHDHWTGETGLPHSVRLNLRNNDTGADLMQAPVFPIYADAPASCAEGKAKCLSLAAQTSSSSEPKPGGLSIQMGPRD